MNIQLISYAYTYIAAGTYYDSEDYDNDDDEDHVHGAVINPDHNWDRQENYDRQGRHKKSKSRGSDNSGVQERRYQGVSKSNDGESRSNGTNSSRSSDTSLLSNYSQEFLGQEEKSDEIDCQKCDKFIDKMSHFCKFCGERVVATHNPSTHQSI
jgi:hypothetical protein